MQTKTIGELCNVIGGKPAPSEKEAFENGVIPFLRMRDLGAYHHTNNLTEIKDKLNLQYVKKKNLKPVKSGALLLPRSGSVALNHRAILGVDAVIVSHVCALEILNGRVLDRQYFYYYMTQVDMSRITKKTTGLDAITFEDLRQIKVPLPDLKIQQDIACILQQADAARHKRWEANRLTEQFLQSAFLEMFGDPVRNERGWEVVSLKTIIRNIDSGWSPVCEEFSRSHDDEWAVLKLGAVTYRVFNPHENKTLPKLLSGRENIEVRKGDVLFSRKNTKELVGATVYVTDTPRKLMMSDTIFRLNYDSGIISGYYIWYLFNEMRFRKRIQSLATGSAGSMPNISKDKLMGFKIPLPPLPLQNKFATLVGQVERLRSRQRESERELEKLFQSLMQRYFG
ncbi:MAG: restriction endonuclease subunit S [Cyclobacteriaceae bacterium]|nr:restriction endonuclease subunit S [Cyclobacteriaceae bacterium]